MNYSEFCVGHNNFSASVYQRDNKYEPLCGGMRAISRLRNLGKFTGLMDAAYDALINTPKVLFRENYSNRKRATPALVYVLVSKALPLKLTETALALPSLTDNGAVPTMLIFSPGLARPR